MTSKWYILKVSDIFLPLKCYSVIHTCERPMRFSKGVRHCTRVIVVVIYIIKGHWRNTLSGRHNKLKRICLENWSTRRFKPRLAFINFLIHHKIILFILLIFVVVFLNNLLLVKHQRVTWLFFAFKVIFLVFHCFDFFASKWKVWFQLFFMLVLVFWFLPSSYQLFFI